VPSPDLRIFTDPEAIESLVRQRRAWATLWEGIARETKSDPDDDSDDSDEEAG
jgi:hypothetical protein